MADSQVKLRSGRVVFRGPKDEAERYLAEHFPRVHVEPGVDYGDDGPPLDAEVVHAPSDDVPDDKENEGSELL
jgi:hypothetical protein